MLGARRSFAVNTRMHLMSGHEAEQFRPVASHPLPFDSPPDLGIRQGMLLSVRLSFIMDAHQE